MKIVFASQRSREPCFTEIESILKFHFVLNKLNFTDLKKKSEIFGLFRTLIL